MIDVIRITSKKDGFRRGGISHPAAATDYPLDHFSQKQIDAFKAESMLTVTGASVDETPEQQVEAEQSDAEQSELKSARAYADEVLKRGADEVKKSQAETAAAKDEADKAKAELEKSLAEVKALTAEVEKLKAANKPAAKAADKSKDKTDKK